MRLRVLPGDSRLWDVERDAQLHLAHAAFFLAAMVVVFFMAKALLGVRR